MGNITESIGEKIKEQEKAWASKRGIRLSTYKDGYVSKLGDNLYELLKPDAVSEFKSGKGKELEGKMLALHSSSALVVNFFHYWHYHDMSIIAKALGLDSKYDNLKFERKYPKPTGIRGIKPHVDVELSGIDVKPIAIEAKFTEQYQRSRLKSMMKNVYIKTEGIWGNLKGCCTLARNIIEGKQVFEYLDAPQLLKHVLGLKTAYGENGFRLLYLWYKTDGIETAEHEKELRRFKEAIGNEVDFQATTYQGLFQKVKSIAVGHQDYIGYMQERYFSPT